MGILSTAVWEFRQEGSNLNGGGFDAGIAGAGTDYSQQDAAQLALTDLAMVAGGTTLTSVTGGFTSAMIGNCIWIASGTNFVVGWYFITAVADTNNCTLDRDATTGGNGSSRGGNVGGARAVLTAAFCTALVAGNIVWHKLGTYTLIENIVIPDGTKAAQIRLYSYKTTRGANPLGTDTPLLADRPTYACGAYTYGYSNYAIISALIFTGTAQNVTAGRDAVSYSIVYKCKATNTSASGGRVAYYANNNSTTTRFLMCEGISTNGTAFWQIRNSGTPPMFCYAHDSVTGFSAGNNAMGLIACVAANCTNGVGGNALTGTQLIKFCTFYNCTTAIYLGGNGSEVMNCVISGNTTGINLRDSALVSFLLGNVMNNTTDYVNVDAGFNDIIADPLLTDPANGDLTLQAGSPAINAGFDLVKVGLTGAYKWNIGVDQDDNTVGGGGAYAFTFVS